MTGETLPTARVRAVVGFHDVRAGAEADVPLTAVVQGLLRGGFLQRLDTPTPTAPGPAAADGDQAPAELAHLDDQAPAEVAAADGEQPAAQAGEVSTSGPGPADDLDQ